jgi:hypothetical protein
MPDKDSTPTKACTKCGCVKPETSEYFLVRSTKTGALKTHCKSCGSAYRKTYYASNKDTLLKDNKAYRESNYRDICAQRRMKYAENRVAIIERNLAYRSGNREAHRERVSRNSKKRMELDPVYAMQRRVKALIGTRLRSGGYSKKSRSHEILGCDWITFKLHIERQFVPGMTWENRSFWHLDHIVPMATAKAECDVIALNHFTNLRPMWAIENIRKSDTVTHLI